MRAWPWLIALAACGDNTLAATVIMDTGEDAPAYGRAPFPTHALREGDHLGVLAGLDVVVRGNADVVAAQLASLDGFGLRPAIEFFVDGALDPDSIPARSTAFTDAALLVDLDRDEVVPVDWIYEPSRGVIAGAVVPGTSLREGTRYAAIVTTDVRATSGEHLRRARGLDGPVTDCWRSTADVVAQLDTRDELVDRIAGVAVFTTEQASSVLVAARRALVNRPRPELTFPTTAFVFDTPAKLDALLGHAARDTTGPRAGLERWGTDNPTGMAHDHVGVVASGKLTIERFRRLDDGGVTPDHGTFELDASGSPLPPTTDLIPVSFVLPKGPVPAAGFPVVIFGHGLGGSRHDMLNLAEPLAAHGYAVVAIDMWGHGSRYRDVDMMNNLGTKPDFTGNATLPDGFGDDPGYAAYIAFFEGFLNVAAIRDSIRQSALDITRVATLVHEADLDLAALAAPYGAPPTLDTRHVAYLGESFGTIVGTDVAALEPSVDLYVLDVPGAGLLDQILPSSATVGSLALPIVQQIYRIDGTLDRFHPLLSIMQAVFDGADPMTFAPHVLGDRYAVAGLPVSVVCLEVLGDEIMANAGTTALAIALGVDVMTPDLDPPPGLAELPSPVAGNRGDRTAVLVQYAPATHGYNWSAEHGTLTYVPGFPHPGDDPYPKLAHPVTIAEPIYETLDQLVEILDTHQAGGPPRVRSTKPPVHDFDGDGIPDDQDPEPWGPGN